MEESEHDEKTAMRSPSSNDNMGVHQEVGERNEGQGAKEIRFMEKHGEYPKEKISYRQESGGDLCKKRGHSTEEVEQTSEERTKKRKCSDHVPEIELGVWPKLVQSQGTSTNVPPQRSRYAEVHHKLHRPWETRSERYSSYPMRPKASLPRNGFITEFGHLGFRDHWKQVFHSERDQFGSERSGAFSRQLGIIGGGDYWTMSQAQLYASYFGPYGRTVAPRECHSCLPSENQGCLLPGKRNTIGAFEKTVNAAAERFRQQFSRIEEEGAMKNVAKGRQSDEDVNQKKGSMAAFWPKMKSDGLPNSRFKGQGAKSPTFEYISRDKTKAAQERPFNCTVCEKSFKRRSSLATHKFIHTDLKPHVCSECNKRFLRKSDLKKHGLMHSGKKPYQCEKCGRRFSQSSNMLTHLRRHMGIRPFECNICARSFFRKVDLKRHEGRHIAKSLKSKCDAE